ncbi:hypothetical protein MUK42_20133 [Musa troglodytarum]|uniref:GH10 domain-containing protein n=1 Tax=Musa troglodytarum TaxID=320322 RepID=A0A9E7HXE2_9LILI|nr:hypothetical protein MUK42_20133 [Musa troglodytarum]
MKQKVNRVQVRKKTVAIRAVDANGHALPGASVSIQQTRSGFPLGCALKNTILQSSEYQSWFAARFTVTTFTNEMKWYSNEPVEGKETYADADAMLAFSKQHGIAVRGHNVVWDNRQYVQNWVQSLPTQKLREAVNRKFNSVMTRYRGQVIAWDVVNENVHFSYFESKLGENASSIFYQQAHQLDPHALMFLNEFNTLEVPVDGKSTPAKYLQKLQQIQSFGNLSRMAIGLEGHFGTPDISYMRAALDTLAGANVPIWLTEVDVTHSNQSKHLEDILREAHSHPAVQGIVIFGVWNPKGCFSRMCLTDVNFKNLPTGDVVDKLLSEWRTHNVAATTDADGLHRAELFHGEYKITINHPSSNSSSVRSLTVDSASQNNNVLTVMGKMSIKWANRTPMGLELRCKWFNPEIEAFNKVMLALRPQVEHIVSAGDASFFFHMAASLSKTLRLKRSLLSVLSSPRLTPLSAFSSSDAPPPPPTYAAASAGSRSQEKERGKWSKALLFLPGAITFGLGTWQLFRRQEKIEMLDYRTKRLEMEPLKWNELSSSDHDFNSLEFRKVICEGDFDESKSVYVGPRSRSISGVTENGFYVITPLVPRITGPGSVQLPVLVNRGWVPRGWRKKLENSENSGRSSTPKIVDAKQIEGSAWWKFWSKESTVTKVEENSTAPTRVIGVVRGSEKPSIFVPENDPSTGQWFYVDVPMIARACGVPDNTLYIEDINEDVSASNPYPIPKDVNTLIRHSVMPQDHLNYTFTWYVSLMA